MLENNYTKTYLVRRNINWIGVREGHIKCLNPYVLTCWLTLIYELLP